MKKKYQWMLAAIRPLVFTMTISGASVFTSCSDKADNPSKDEPEQAVNEFLDEEKGDVRYKNGKFLGFK